MKRLFLHSKNVFRNHWFIICIAWAVSFILGIGLFILLLAYSLAFKEDPVDVNDILNTFTEEELGIVLDETVDENISDEDYLTLLARYQSYFCPKKVDYMTMWMGSEVTDTSYIMYYEVKKNFEAIDQIVLRENILSQINRNSVQAIRIARSHMNMVFKYTDRKTCESFDIVISNQELMAA